MKPSQFLKECAARRLSYPLNNARATWLYRRGGNRAPVPGLRFFCQNSGSCGSMYVVELLKVNGYDPCYHEKRPDLDDLGIDYFEGKADADRLEQVLIRTRRDVFFEANNRLFSVGRILKKAFPDARFIHLHRDPRDMAVSALSKPEQITWNSGRRRYTSDALGGPVSAPILDRACRYWANYNQRIVDDLQGEDYLSLKFSDLIAGNLDALETFMDIKLPNRKIAPVNAKKPVRKEGRRPPFKEWPAEEQETVHRICGPLMDELGYERRLGDAQ